MVTGILLRLIVVIDAVVIVIFTAAYVIGNYLPVAVAVLVVLGMGFQVWAALSPPRTRASRSTAPAGDVD